MLFCNDLRGGKTKEEGEQSSPSSFVFTLPRYTTNIMKNRISGKKIADRIKKELQESIAHSREKITFAIIYVGSDPVIDNFIRYKEKFGKTIGVEVVIHRFPDFIKERDLIDEVWKIFSNKKNDAVIIQLPLPDHISAQAVLDTVPVAMDVDVLGESAKDLFRSGDNEMFPPVTGAIVEILKSQKFSLEGKNIVIFGYGNLVGKPFGAWLERQNIPYHVIDRETAEQKKKELLQNADLIVSGAGVPRVIKAEDIKNGVALIDGGTSEAGKKVVGDIDPSCYEKALFYTPVPGGIGPLTIAVLYQNILKAVKFR